jgi:eukaryotic-like serine/threonine-protein kinase
MADSSIEQSQALPQGFRPGTIVDGRYRVLRLIGGGGNGLVHEVEHVPTGERLALKSLLDPTAAQRLEQEARATSLLTSPRAVKIIDVGTTATEGPYLVMELLSGQSLRDLLLDAGQLPLELTVNVALQVGECLAEAHAVGIVHRDLKPDNIHLTPGAEPDQYDVKVLDFGIVKIASDSAVPGGLTRTGSTVGTPYYMSLEQLRNPRGVDGRSDLYSLGVVLYECLTGRKPYDADTIGDLVYALCSGPPTDIARLRPDLPQPVCRAIMRALTPNRDGRQGTIGELCADLLPFGAQPLGAWISAQPRPAAGAVLAVSTPSSGVRPIEGPGALVPPSDPRKPARTEMMDEGPAPVPAPVLNVSGDGARDTPTTFYVKPERPELPERLPDSERTRMLPDDQRPPDVVARIPSKAPFDSTKTTPFTQMPGMPSEASGMMSYGMGNAAGAYGPHGQPGPGGMAQGYGPQGGPGGSVPPGQPGGMGGYGPQGVMSSNMPPMGMQPMGGPFGGAPPPAWMAVPGQTQPQQPMGLVNKLKIQWLNATPRDQLIIAVGSASVLVALLLILLWIIVR